MTTQRTDADLTADARSSLAEKGVQPRTRVVTEVVGYEGTVLNLTTADNSRAQIYAYVKTTPGIYHGEPLADWERELLGDKAPGDDCEQRIVVTLTERANGYDSRERAAVNFSRSEALRLHTALGLILDATSEA